MGAHKEGKGAQLSLPFAFSAPLLPFAFGEKKCVDNISEIKNIKIEFDPPWFRSAGTLGPGASLYYKFMEEASIIFISSYTIFDNYTYYQLLC